MTGLLWEVAIAAPIGDRWFEVYVPGSGYEFGYASLSETKIVAFTRDHDPQSIHTDPTESATGPVRRVDRERCARHRRVHASPTSTVWPAWPRALMDFRDRLALARAHAHLRAMEVVQQAMRGRAGYQREPLRDKEGNVLCRDDGEILCVRRYSQPDGRLALQYLARSAPDLWGPHATPTLGLTGQLDPTTKDESSADQISLLSGRLARVVAQRRAEDEEAEGDHGSGIDRAAGI